LLNELIAKAGCTLIYLPVYSPDLNSQAITEEEAQEALERFEAYTFRCGFWMNHLQLVLAFL